MSINSRNKGAAAERDFCKQLCEIIGVQLVRNLEQTRSGGYDLIPADQEEAEEWPWAIEIKRYATVTDAKIKGWLEQSVEQAEQAGKTPVLAYRADRQEWKVMIPVGEWISIPSPKGAEAYQWATVDMGVASLILAGHFELELKDG